MVRNIIRVIGALLALVGLALVVVGVWFAMALGGSGTATFTTRPAAGQPVLLSPDVLNRVDADVVVTATPSAGGTVWMALANPTDADAVLGDSRHVNVTGVVVRDWRITSRSVGSGEPPTLGNADLWRQQDDGKEPVSLTVEQSQAPEAVVVAAQGGDIDRLTITVTDKRWFVEAVVAALVGLFLLVAGVIALWPRRRREPAPAPEVDPAPTAQTEEVAR